MRIGIGIGEGVGEGGALNELLARIQQAEADGFASAWMANIFGFDAITALALAGRETSRIELGTFVVPTYPRHPAALAQQSLTASLAAGGRFTLGIGLSHKVVIENMFGLDYSKPFTHMRDYLAVLNPLLRQEAVRHSGPDYRVAAQINVPGAAAPPLLVAALGPRMLRLAGEAADGTAVWMGGPAYLEKTAVPAITAAARKAGRPAPRIAAGFPIAVTAKVDGAREAAAKTFAVYGQLPSYRAILDIEGAADPSSIAIVGDEATVEEQLRHLASIGVTDFNASPFNVPSDSSAKERTYELLKALTPAI